MVWLAAVSVFTLMSDVGAQEAVTGPVRIYEAVYERVDPGPYQALESPKGCN